MHSVELRGELESEGVVAVGTDDFIRAQVLVSQFSGWACSSEILSLDVDSVANFECRSGRAVLVGVLLISELGVGNVLLQLLMEVI